MTSKYRPKDEYRLEEADFQREWKDVHRAVFRTPATEGRTTYWLPNQLFRSARPVSFCLDPYFFLEAAFDGLRRALADLGETEFVIVGAEKQFGLRSEEPRDRKLIYPSQITWEEYAQGRDVPAFFLAVQPMEFYLHGRRRDWGIVASTEYGIAILGAEGEARDAFQDPFENDVPSVRDPYLRSAPPEYAAQFAKNYLA